MKLFASRVIYLLILFILTLAHARKDTECDGWISTVLTFDADSSGGLSKREFYSSIIEGLNRRYAADDGQLQDYDDLPRLPWSFLVAYYAMTCYCQILGQGEGCCEGDAEIPLDLDDKNYKEIMCQQVAFVMKNTVAGPVSTTVGPSESPLLMINAPISSPSERPGEIIEENSTTAPATTSSTTTGTTTPLITTTTSPSITTTSSPTTAITERTSPTITEMTPHTPGPTESSFVFVNENKTNNPNEAVSSALSAGSEGLNGGITIGISLSVIAVIIAISVCIVAHHRKKRLRREMTQSAEEECAATRGSLTSTRRRRTYVILLSFVPFLTAAFTLGTVLIVRGTFSTPDEKSPATIDAEAMKNENEVTVNGDVPSIADPTVQTDFAELDPSTLERMEVTTNQTSSLPQAESGLIAHSAALQTKKHSKLRSGSPTPAP